MMDGTKIKEFTSLVSVSEYMATESVAIFASVAAAVIFGI